MPQNFSFKSGFVTETNNNGHDVFPLLDRIGLRKLKLIEYIKKNYSKYQANLRKNKCNFLQVSLVTRGTTGPTNATAVSPETMLASST